MSPQSPLKVALTGSPNCGKTALFNALTGGHQKVGNYAGVTVERKEGTVVTSTGLTIHLLDLPGTYSLDARSMDEAIARDAVLGQLSGEEAPSVLVAVADATNLERGLSLVLELRDLEIPAVLALNMMDLAQKRGIELDLQILARELGIAVVPTVATRREGMDELLKQVENCARVRTARAWRQPTQDEVRARYKEIDRILKLAIRKVGGPTLWTDRLDRFAVHPVWGTITLAVLLLLMFQAIFTWASVPADAIEGGLGAFGEWVSSVMPDGALRSLLVDGIIAGVGGVLVFLPQILLLFAFILVLEDSGYMARAAFLMDRIMGRVGLNGRAFIPLLSSYACAIPGIMSTRAISDRRDRFTTILVAPLTTCSARLPVYTLLIGAFIPDTKIAGFINLQGFVMFALYALGLLLTLAVAAVFKRTVFKGPKPPLIMELPTYKWPSPRSIIIGLWERGYLFVRRAGTVILSLTVLIWFLSSYPKAPEGYAEPAINYSYAGRLGHAIEPVIKPLGFDWRIGIALIPGFAAREVMVSALATVYAVEGEGDDAVSEALGTILVKDWSIATALSLLAWYVVALQCLSTIAVAKRETNSWKWPAVMLIYLTALAYAVSFATYRIAIAAGLG